MPAFCCTGEPKRQPGSFKKVHERPWELDVQSAVRSRRPPYQPPLFMIVGLDGEGIAAAAIYEEPTAHEDLTATGRKTHRLGFTTQRSTSHRLVTHLPMQSIIVQQGHGPLPSRPACGTGPVGHPAQMMAWLVSRIQVTVPTWDVQTEQRRTLHHRRCRRSGGRRLGIETGDNRHLRTPAIELGSGRETISAESG